MKRTAASIVLAVAALAMLIALVVQSRSLPLGVHLSQNTISTEIERVRDDFAALAAALQSSHAEILSPGDASVSLLARVESSPRNLAPLVAQIPGGASQQNRLANALESFSRSVADAHELADQIIAEQTAYAGSVSLVRDEGPRIIQQMRDLNLEREAADTFQLIVQTLDFAARPDVEPDEELGRLLTALRRDQRVVAGMPENAAPLLEAMDVVLGAKAPLQSKLRELGGSPLPERAWSLGTAASQVYRAGAARVEQARLMLSVYSIALLIVVGFAVVRLQASYRALNRSHAKLAELNESLEQRVAARTDELAGTLHDLKESQVQLVQAEKMSSLGQLVAGISHEINTPLLYLTNNAALIQERLQALQHFITACSRAFSMDAEHCKDRADFQQKFIGALKQLKRMLQQEDLEASVQEAQDLAQDSIEGLEDLTEMAQSLKDFSRLDRAPVASFDVNSGLDKTLMIARNVIKHKAEVRRFYGELPEIECSPSQINQVFLNLLTNAAQAIETQGEIAVTTRRHDDFRVAISVADNGCGIPAEIIDKIRDPFFTTKEVGTGTGLGLSIVDEIVRAHGGELRIESQPGRGSVFTVILPIQHASRQGEAPMAEEAPAHHDDDRAPDHAGAGELAEAV